MNRLTHRPALASSGAIYVLSLVLATLLFVAGACTSNVSDTRHEDLAPPAKNSGEDYGRVLFKARCSECHDEPMVWSRDDFNWHRVIGDNNHYWLLPDHDRRALLVYLTGAN